MLHVQQFLSDQVRNGLTPLEAFDKLEADFAITSRKYPEEGIALLDYDMIESPKLHPIVIECRSLILNIETFEVVSRKFNRFFNYGESPEYYTDFNWSSSLVMEKCDGSLIGVYYYNGKWNISTRGMAFAEGNTPLNAGTFADAVVSAFGFNDEKWQDLLSQIFNRDCTYIFEYTSPLNRVVTPYTKTEMVLLGISSKLDVIYTVEDMSALVQKMQYLGLSVRMPKLYPMTASPAELLDTANSLEGLAEGFVVWDTVTNKRYKIKSKLYVVAHSMKGNDPLPTRKNLLTLYFIGELDEFISYFPEYKDLATNVTNEVSGVLHELNTAWEANKHIESQKEFAMAIKNVKFNGVLFSARKTKTTPHAAFAEINTDRKVNMFLG